MIYLDNAATTMVKPPPVIQAVTEAMSLLGNGARGAHDAALLAARTVYAAREEAASFFHAGDVSEVVFTSGVTEALNIAIRGILTCGDHVVTTVCEHNSVLRPLYDMERAGVTLSVAGADDKGRIDPEQVREAMRDNTRAIVVTAASNVSGNLTELRTLSEIAHEAGALLIVDGAQAGGFAHIDCVADGIDVFCFAGHKGLCGPQGTGGMIVKKGVRIRPLKTGGSGTHSFSRTHPEDMPEALEAGTLNGHGIAGLLAAFRWLSETGLSRIRAHESSLAKRFYDSVKTIPGIRFYGDYDALTRCPLVALNLGEEDAAYVADRLSADFGIAVRAGAHCAPLMHEHFGTKEQGIVRFSFGYFNTEDECDLAADALRQIAGDCA